MKKNHTGVILIVDRSGSMGGCERDTIDSISDLIKEQKSGNGTAEMGIVQFGSTIDELVIKDIKDVNPIIEYYTNGMTALCDAIGRTVTQYGKILAERPESERPEQVHVHIITDGYENHSVEFSKSKINELIKHQEKVYNWKFIFIGADIDVFAEGDSIGIKKSATLSYDKSSIGIKSAYAAASSYTSSLRAGVSVESLCMSDIYNEELNKVTQ